MKNKVGGRRFVEGFPRQRDAFVFGALGDDDGVWYVAVGEGGV